MNKRIVKTQAELEAAIKDGVDLIEIHSDSSVWLQITNLGSSRAELWGSSRAELRESSRAELWESSRAELWGSSRAVLRESSSATLRESSRAVLLGSSSATLWESSSAELLGSSSATLWGSSSAVLWGSSSATLWESSRAELWGSSRANAREESTVVAHGGSVNATAGVAVHIHDATVSVSGGVILDHTKIKDFSGAEWCAYHGVKVSRGIATLYKAVNAKWTTDRGVDYSPGSLPKCDDFRDTDECGGGLHVGPTPRHALAYQPDAVKFVAVFARVSEIIQPITGSIPKAKIPRAVKPCIEVDIDGNPIKREEAA